MRLLPFTLGPDSPKSNAGHYIQGPNKARAREVPVSQNSSSRCFEFLKDLDH